ncbi:RNA dependent RNA polymerase [Paenibacillus sp. UNC496MF]|uniref:RNA dependent RNA polymerase n=1 Tax=Paenibacillus sp. UNC496MF TaxID=1502753 RepID=UPI0008F1565C|nr:hypothetical protein [Paenibacillus sp. UNC496MF]SFJ62815.1 RNA dependent RNA polymerase [Paenibacillus sp. UNC496MF]
MTTQSATNNTFTSAADVLGALATFPGIREGGKNFDAVINAMVEGNSLLNVLHDPTGIAGIAPQQAHHFARFVAAHELPDHLKPKKRDAIQTLIADINFMTRDADGWLVSTLKYNDPTRDNGFDFKSENQMADTFASEPVVLQIRKKLSKGEMVVEKRARLMHDIVTVKMNWILEEGQSEFTAEQLSVHKELNEKGFKLIINGQEKYAKMIQQTNSQARQVMENFLVCDNEFDAVPDFFMKLGHNLIAYAKKNADGTMTIDCTKYMSRIGLSGTSSVNTRSISIGSDIQENDELYSVVGGNFTMRIQPDVHVKIRTGQYKVMNAQTHEFEVFDAANHPVDMVAGDGLIFVNERVYKALVAEHGVDVDAWQVRITPFGKGLAVYVPGLEKTFAEDIVAFNSAIKGDFRDVVGAHKIQFRIALFNKPAKKVKKFTEYPYQFVHGTSLTAEDMMELVRPHVDKVVEMLQDADKLKEYLGMDHLDGASDEQLDKALVTTLMTFLHEAPFTYKDVQMKKFAVQHVMDMIKNWVVGSIPIRGNYKFMVHDPIAIVDAIALDRKLPGKLRDEDGNISIPSNLGLSAGTVVVRDLKDAYIEGEVGMQRNPLIAKSESAFAMAVKDVKYARAGHYRNLCIMSVHDFNTAKQGGADNDGDKTLVVYDQTIIKAIKRNAHLPALLDVHVVEYNDGEPVFDSGCPKTWSKAPENVYEIPASMIVKQSGFKVTFNKDQYNDALINELHKLTKNYITRTLKPNQIGMLTNYATKLADAVRAMGYQYALGVNAEGNALTAEDKKELLGKVKQFEQWIDLLRLCQGWEIDAAKHGGAFWDELANELSFIQDPPKEVGYVNKKGVAVWYTPDWMGARNEKEHAVATGSVLSRVFTDMVKERAGIQASVSELDKRNEGTNIFYELNAAIAMTPERMDALKPSIVEIDREYRLGIKQLMEKEAAAKERAIAAADGNKQKLEYYLELVKQQSKEEREMLIESCAGQLERLEDVFLPEEIGFVAYKVAYIDNKSESTTFPWTAAKRQLLAACQVAAGTIPTRLPQIATRKADVEIKMQLVNPRSADLIAKAVRNGYMDVKLVEDQLTGMMQYAVGVENVLLGYVYHNSAIWFNGMNLGRVHFTTGRNLSDKSVAIAATHIQLA